MECSTGSRAKFQTFLGLLLIIKNNWRSFWAFYNSKPFRDQPRLQSRRGTMVNRRTSDDDNQLKNQSPMALIVQWTDTVVSAQGGIW